MSMLGRTTPATYGGRGAVPNNYKVGFGRGAVGFTTRSDIGPADSSAAAPQGYALVSSLCSIYDCIAYYRWLLLLLPAYLAWLTYFRLLFRFAGLSARLPPFVALLLYNNGEYMSLTLIWLTPLCVRWHAFGVSSFFSCTCVTLP